jgi:hypothetical protein
MTDKLQMTRLQPNKFVSIKGRSEPVKARKRRLVFALSNRKEPLPIREIVESPQLVRLHSNPGASILKHDIDELVEEGLLVRYKGKIRANLEAISGFKNIAAV